MQIQYNSKTGELSVLMNYLVGALIFGSLTLPFKPHNTQILYLSLLLAYFFVKFEKIIRASLH